MGVIVKKVELTWLDRTYVWPVLQGMSITFGHFIRNLFTSTAKRYTVQYPDMKREIPAGYRGLHELKRFEDGAIKCVACFMCQEACPARCISIEAEEFSDLNLSQGFQEKRPAKFSIDMLRCIYCGMCEEACPVDAIVEGPNFEYATETRAELMYNKSKLLANGDRWEVELAFRIAADAPYR